MSIKLTYFEGNGRAFAARAALRHAKVPFDDIRLAFPVFAEMRDKQGGYNPKIPLGQLPVLELPSGQTFPQSAAIARWAAKKSDLYPKDDVQALTVDVITDSAAELSNKVPNDPDPAQKKLKREEFMVKTFPRYMTFFTETIKASGGPFVLGKQFSLADLNVFSLVSTLESGFYDHLPKDAVKKDWPVVQALYDAAKEHPVVKAELAAAPVKKKD